jgi:hypothetical protein
MRPGVEGIQCQRPPACVTWMQVGEEESETLSEVWWNLSLEETRVRVKMTNKTLSPGLREGQSRSRLRDIFSFSVCLLSDHMNIHLKHAYLQHVCGGQQGG